MGGDSGSRSHGFESQHRIMDVLFQLVCCKNCNERTENKRKRGQGCPLKSDGSVIYSQVLCFFQIHSNLVYRQCDQIRRFIGLWTFLKPLAIIIFPKSSTFLGIFVKVSKSIMFLVKSYLGNFYSHLAIFFWSHCLPTIITYHNTSQYVYKNWIF